MAELNRKFNRPNILKAQDASDLRFNFRAPVSGDGFDKSTDQSGIFVRGKDIYKVYASIDGTTWTLIQEVDPDHDAFIDGFNFAWGDYTKMAFESSSAKQRIRVVGLQGPIIVDTTDDGVYNPDSVIIDSGSPVTIVTQGDATEAADGEKGAQGAPGATGAKGAKGEAGADAAGTDGDKGQKGEAGSGGSGSGTLDYSSDNQSTFLGTSAGDSQQSPANNPVTGAEIESENVGVGYQALQDTTTGTNNVAIGSNSLSENTTGFNNVAISKGALGDYLLNNTTIGIGFDTGAPHENSEAIDGHVGNTMMGHQAMDDFNVKSTASLSNNTAIGLRALRGIGGTDTSPKLNNVKNNTAIGRQAGLGIVHTSGGALNHNTFLGNSAGMNAVPQQGNMMSNLLLGARAGMSGYIGDNNIVMQNATADTALGNANWGVSGNIAIGGNAALYSDNNVIIGNGADSAPNIIGASDIDDETKGANQSGNIILAGSGNTISNIGGKKVQTNSILSGTNITIGDGIEAKDNFIANCKGITMRGNNNVFIGTELTSEDTTQLVRGNRLTVINSSSYMLADGANDITLISSEDVSVAAGGDQHMILESRDITVTSECNKSVILESQNTNLAGAERTVAILDDGSTINSSSYDTLVLNSKTHTVDGRGNTLIGGSSNSVPNGSEDNVFIGGTNSSTAQNADYNVLLGVYSTTDIAGSNNVIAGTGHTAINDKVKWSLITGSGHTLSPAANAQRNVITGYQNTVTSGNNSFIGGTKSDINQSNSFGYGKGIKLEHGNMAGFGKFNDGAANDGADALFTVGCGANDNIRRNAMNVVLSTIGGTNNKAVLYLDQVVSYNYENDSAASDAGIGVGGLYHTEGTLKIRIA
tara:strand:+ start:733 stop:3345 length:2613 start_codon:yes stop_codon:yes gene_type:complete